MDPKWCRVFQPTKDEFAQPFTDYVGGIFRDNPDLPCFKVVPPACWQARQDPFPELDTIKINTPIRQHVFGKAGAYRCVLVEHKGVSVAEYRQIAEEEAAKVTGHKGQAGSACAKGVYGHALASREQSEAALHSKDDLSERSFWASVTLNPPLYGADTPLSFFDEKLAYGWNLRSLGDLLNKEGVPEVPGVTTPMTYFGMWRAFFGWHKEDADLLSINYVHFGAPKVWYCVSPKHKDKFERMAASLFPQQAQTCSAFIRHKDILISPSQLRSFDIPFVQAKQLPGEFMVLNAAAYHAGFNMGFNCAEAINFATQDWIAVGKVANRCRCNAMKDAVHLSMSLFDPSWQSPGQSEAEESEEEEADDSGFSGLSNAQRLQRKQERLLALMRHSGAAGQAARTQSDPIGSGGIGNRQGNSIAGRSGSGSGSRMDQEGASNGSPSQTRLSGGALSPAAQQLLKAYGRLPGRNQKRPLTANQGETPSPAVSYEPAAVAASAPAAPAPRSAALQLPANAEVEVMDLISSDDDNNDNGAGEAQVSGRQDKGTDRTPAKPAHMRSSSASQPTSQPNLARASNSPSPVQPFRGLPGSRPTTRRRIDTLAPAQNTVVGSITQQGTGSAPQPQKVTYRWGGGVHSVPPPSRAILPAEPGPFNHVMEQPVVQQQQQQRRLPAAGPAPSRLAVMLQKDPVQGPPFAVVWEDERGQRFFHLVQKLKRVAPCSKQHVLLRLLRESSDGLYYPCDEIWEELATTLVEIRTQPVARGCQGDVPGYRLMTMPSRILSTELVPTVVS